MENKEKLKITDLQIGQSIYVIDRTLASEDKAITVCEIVGLSIYGTLSTIYLRVINGTYKRILNDDKFFLVDGDIYSEGSSYTGFTKLEEAIEYRNDLIATRIGELSEFYL